MNINIDTGEIRLTVNGDPARVIRFNPRDIGFAERFYEIAGDFEQKKKEYAKRAAALDAEKDRSGEKNMPGGLALLRDICVYMRGRIDYVFGAGTSAAAFGNAMTLDMFGQFFNGVTPFVQQARAEKLAKYTAVPEPGVME